MTIFQDLALPKVIYETSSQYNEHIDILEMGRTRRLRVNNTTQSVNYDSPVVDRMIWGRTVQLIQEEAPQLKNILILGLGGGTIQHLLAKSYPGLEIVSVDIDRVMYEVAVEYFDLEQIPNHKVIIDDACRVIVEPHEYEMDFRDFDALMVDIYIGSDYPDLGTSGNFFAHIKKMVHTDGLIVINRIYTHDHQQDVNAFIENVEMYLRDVQSLIIPGKTNSDNILIYGRV